MAEAVNLQMHAGIGEASFDMLRKPWGLEYLRVRDLAPLKGKEHPLPQRLDLLKKIVEYKKRKCGKVEWWFIQFETIGKIMEHA